MAASATLNVRLPEPLKNHGTQVLEREGLGPSEAIRALYEYMEREQSVPECIKQADKQDKYAARRNLLREFAGCASDNPLPENWTMKDIKDRRLARLIGADAQ